MQAVVDHVAVAMTRMKEQQILQQSEARLKLAQVSAGAGIWDWDMGTGKLKWSDELFGLLGLDPHQAEASFDGWKAVIQSDDRQYAEEQILAAIEQRIPLTSEYRVVLPSGDIRWISALGNTSYDVDGKPLRMSGICLDITERKDMEQALVASERKYRELIDTANSIIIRWDRQGIIHFINEHGAQLLGYEAKELTGREVSCLVPQTESNGGNISSLAQDILDHPERYVSNTNENLKKDGTRVWFAWTNKAITDEDGKVREILAVGNDITSLKIAEDALRESNEELSRFNRAVIGRELRIIEMKKEVNHFCMITGQPPRYPLDFEKEDTHEKNENRIA